MASPRDIYYPEAVSIADELGIPANIFTGMIEKESGWNPRAVGTSGDIGLGQLTPVIYKSDQYKTNPWNPIDNLRTSAKFLRDEFNRLGSWRDALAAYNSGWNPNAKGYAYADDILSKTGDIQPASESVFSKAGKLFEKFGLTGIPGIGGPVDAAKGYIQDKTQEGIKSFIANNAIWVVAGVMILIGLWRVINAR